MRVIRIPLTVAIGCVPEVDQVNKAHHPRRTELRGLLDRLLLLSSISISPA